MTVNNGGKDQSESTNETLRGWMSDHVNDIRNPYDNVDIENPKEIPSREALRAHRDMISANLETARGVLAVQLAATAIVFAAMAALSSTEKFDAFTSNLYWVLFVLIAIPTLPYGLWLVMWLSDLLSHLNEEIVWCSIDRTENVTYTRQSIINDIDLGAGEYIHVSIRLTFFSLFAFWLSYIDTYATRPLYGTIFSAVIIFQVLVISMYKDNFAVLNRKIISVPKVLARWSWIPGRRCWASLVDLRSD